MTRLKCLRPVLAPAPVNGWKPDTVRGNRHERGYGTAWDKLRAEILERDRRLCVRCLAEHDRTTPATEVDHITPKAQGGTDHPSNLQSLCHPCHKAKTARESTGQT